MKKVITRNTAIFSITSFLTDLSSEMIFPLLPLFLVSILGASEFEVGLIEGIAVGAIGLFSLLSVFFVNKLGNERKTAIFGYGLSSIMKIGFVLASTWPQILMVRFLERAGKGVRIVARDTLIVLSENKKKWGLAFGIRQCADMLGKIAGPLAAGILLYLMIDFPIEDAYRNVFIIATIPALLSIPLLLFVKQRGEPKKTSFSEIKKYLSSSKHSGMLSLVAIIFLANFSVMFFILRASEFMPYYMVPLAYIGFSAMFSLFSVPSGILVDRLGIKKMFILGLIVYLIALTIFGYYPSLVNIFIGFILLGLFEAILKINAKMFATRNGGQERYNIIFGTYQSVVRLVKLPSNLIAGFLWLIPFYGSPLTFAFGMILTIASLILVIKRKTLS